MNRRPTLMAVVIAAVALVWAATPAMAHRLDEYLQATTIRLARDHVEVGVRLTPGVAVAGPILAALDTDGDGAIADAERAAYAERINRDLSLTVDGRPASMRLTASTFPTVDAIRGGVGELVLAFDADVPTGTGSDHTIAFCNRHSLPGAAPVYLVNCLVPRDPGLRVTGQDRSYNQSTYQVTYIQAAVGDPTPTTARTDAIGTASLVRAYLYHGVRHILTGYDHLLFVGALVLAADTLWDLVKVVTSFTVAHTLTLTLAAVGWVHLSGRVVEPLIAASIVVVAVQNVLWPRQARGWVRLAAAFFFGLFHGLGFAGGLLDAMHQMPAATLLLAIAAFSLGIELGHQAVVLPLFAALKVARSSATEPVLRARRTLILQRVGSTAIAAAGGYYLFLALAGRA